MVFPLYDDNTDRTTTPIVNYVADRDQYPGLCFPAATGNERQIHLCVFDRAAGDH